MVATLLMTVGASADHEVRVHHQAPPAAVAGSDLQLVFVVENDGLWGEGLATLRFWDRAGALRVVVETIQVAPPAEPVVFQIDRAYVPDHRSCYWYSHCEISYEFEVEIQRCIFAYDCHAARAEIPRTTIPVVGTLAG
jgi:hypothetical protein